MRYPAWTPQSAIDYYESLLISDDYLQRLKEAHAERFSIPVDDVQTNPKLAWVVEKTLAPMKRLLIDERMESVWKEIGRYARADKPYWPEMLVETCYLAKREIKKALRSNQQQLTQFEDIEKRARELADILKPGKGGFFEGDDLNPEQYGVAVLDLSLCLEWPKFGIVDSMHGYDLTLRSTNELGELTDKGCSLVIVALVS
ncbi:MAG: hypothetical protein R3F53_18185, partial [Gammaproteobacteria bacterium]